MQPRSEKGPWGRPGKPETGKFGRRALSKLERIRSVLRSSDQLGGRICWRKHWEMTEECTEQVRIITRIMGSMESGATGAGQLESGESSAVRLGACAFFLFCLAMAFKTKRKQKHRSFDQDIVAKYLVLVEAEGWQIRLEEVVEEPRSRCDEPARA